MSLVLQRRTPLVTALVLAVGVGGGLLLTGRDGTGGAVAPAAFDLPDLRGGPENISLASLAGRPAVVSFFASWCDPCRRELPALADAHRRYGDRVAFVGIDHADSRTNALEMLDEFGITYPAGYDPQGVTAPAYGLRGLPDTVFITADGRVLETHRGELDRGELEERIERLLEASAALRTRGS